MTKCHSEILGTALWRSSVWFQDFLTTSELKSILSSVSLIASIWSAYLTARSWYFAQNAAPDKPITRRSPVSGKSASVNALSNVTNARLAAATSTEKIGDRRPLRFIVLKSSVVFAEESQ